MEEITGFIVDGLSPQNHAKFARLWAWLSTKTGTTKTTPFVTSDPYAKWGYHDEDGGDHLIGIDETAVEGRPDIELVMLEEQLHCVFSSHAPETSKDFSEKFLTALVSLAGLDILPVMSREFQTMVVGTILAKYTKETNV